MSSSKKHNSIIFLTTLSVYLGLVLVGGASSSVLAQAALTRNFDIQEEIEYKDDLDKKPEGTDCWDKSSKDVTDLLNSNFLSDGILAFVSDLQNLSEVGKYEKGERFNFQFTHKSTESERGRIEDTSPLTSNEWVRLAASDRVENLCSSRFYRFDDELKTKASHSTVKFSWENDELIVKISKEQESNQIAAETADLYNEVFATGICTDYVEKSQKVIYQNSKAFAENNQVFIITNLPRASIDSLLADKDAN